MGGTSCDVALIKDGEPFVASRGKIDGRDLAVPMLDINTVSAGGGTIAARRPLRRAAGRAAERGRHAGAGLLRPRRRRRRPSPTAISCWAISSEDNFLGGQMRLDAAKARRRDRGKGRAPARHGREPRPRKAIVRIIDVKMEEAIKAISTMRGHDLRDFMLLAFGGAGPCMPAASPAISAWPA